MYNTQRSKYLLICILYFSFVGFSKAQTMTYGSISVYSANLCTPPSTFSMNIQVFVNGYNMNDIFTIKVIFDDGIDSTFTITHDTTGASKYYLVNYFGHKYSSPGVYYPSVEVTDKNSQIHTYTIQPSSAVILSDVCDNIQGKIYYDKNNNCLYDTGDSIPAFGPVNIQLDDPYKVLNAYADANGDFKFSILSGLSGTIFPAYLPTGYGLTCPSNNSFTSTTSTQVINLGIQKLSNTPLAAFSDVPASKVLVVYNDNTVPDGTYSGRDYNANGINDSKELAEYYQQKRNVPASNLLGVKPRWFEISNDSLYAQVVWDDMLVPIRNKINSLGDTNIYYILLMEAVSMGGNYHGYIFSLDNSLIALNKLGTRAAPDVMFVDNPICEKSPERFGEIGQFNHKMKLNGTHIYPVSRITHWNLDMEINMIDMTLYGEKYLNLANGYYNGTSYLDVRYGPYDSTALANGMPYFFGGYNNADQGIATIENYYKQRGMPYKIETTGYDEIGANSSSLFADGSPADSGRKAMLYAGWYNFYHYYDKWDWIPGSFACDLNSGSASKLTWNPGRNESWLSNAFSEGLTCGTGVYDEPGVSGHSRANSFMYYFLNGYNFVESAIHAEPYLKFKGAAIGDPLYNPFKVGKPAVKDLSIEPSVISYEFLSDTTTTVHLDYASTVSNPEVVKAWFYWGTSTAYSDTINADSLYFAHHKFGMTGLTAGVEYHFKICVLDPVNNAWCSSDQVFKTDGTILTDVNEAKKENDQLRILSNPVTDDVLVNYTVHQQGNALLEVHDCIGKIVFSTNTVKAPGTYIEKIGTGELKQGVYFVRLITDNSIETKKIVKQ